MIIDKSKFRYHRPPSREENRILHLLLTRKKLNRSKWNEFSVIKILGFICYFYLFIFELGGGCEGVVFDAVGRDVPVALKMCQNYGVLTDKGVLLKFYNLFYFFSYRLF